MRNILLNNNTLTRTGSSLLAIASLLSLTGCERSPRNAAETQLPKTTEQAPASTPSAEKKEIALVRSHQAVCALILPDKSSEILNNTVHRFVDTVERSTGARIPQARASEEASLDPKLARIYVGPSPKMKSMGIKADALPQEGYRILTSGNEIFILGQEEAAGHNPLALHSRPTLWALNYLLEKHLGVRWLWPGPLGTYIPKKADFTITQTDITYQPKLEQRILRANLKNAGPLISGEGNEELDFKLKSEIYEWLENHQSGRRATVRFGHAFEHWWNKYGQEHPDYFAVPPEGMTQPVYNQPGRVKLRLSNPAVLEQIAEEYKAAGAPDYWNVCPNDGGGFDLGIETRAWDIPKDQSPDDIWKARANLTGRYVQFWNLLYQKLKAINPNVKLATYAYGSYKTPPPGERPMTAHAAIGIVCGFHDYDLWRGWTSQPGTRDIFLRPNWGHIGANAPYLPLKDMATFMRFASENKMRGFDLDSIVGFWATQGTNYYLLARMLTHPELSADDVLDEYVSAFGEGAKKIREYFEYWQQRTTEYAYPEAYAEDNGNATKSKFLDLVKQGKTEINFVRGPRYALPYLYPDEVLQPAYHLLDEAEAAIGNTDPDSAQRVAFLRDGLRELAATRDVIEMARKIKPSSPKEMLVQFHKMSDELEKFREELAPRHVVWGHKITTYEDNYRVPMRPRNMKLPELNMDGL